MDVFLHISAQFCTKELEDCLASSGMQLSVCATENQLWICQTWSEFRVRVRQILLSTSSPLIGPSKSLLSHWSDVRLQATTVLRTLPLTARYIVHHSGTSKSAPEGCWLMKLMRRSN